MLYEKKEFTLKFGEHDVTVETSRLAKQADSSVLVSAAGTQVLVTLCCARKVNDGQDFFPLLVDYKEKFYGAGKFLGGFLKREGRPSNSEILTMRLIDRPLRPLFPEGFMFETIVMAQVLSFNPEGGDPEVLAGLGAAAALTISDVPFAGPMGYCKVGLIDGQYILNPSREQFEKAKVEILMAASKDAILMVEGESDEATEQEMLDAILYGHKQIKEFCSLLDKMRSEVGKEKREFTSAAPNQGLIDSVTEKFSTNVREVLNTTDKQERTRATSNLIDTVKEALKSAPADFSLTEDDDFGKEAGKVVDEVLYKMMRADITQESKRIAGRGLTEVREIQTETSVLSHVHGSSLFSRGETQVLAAVTIGGKEGEQMSDSIRGVGYDKFYLHYSMPPFSVGEARGYRGVGRREIGHGNLAERAIKKVLPTQEEFPYTIRVACEVLESNGSSSMGSVCSGSMALMDAGVPLRAPVAGVAMGLIKEGSDFKILTDILGDEDHLGDMDFKVAGTEKGITAIQMDIKITGINEEIMTKALTQAREGRLHILGEMSKTITENRKSFKAGVPQVKMTKIAPDKIGALIGPGGKNIKALQETFEVNMEVDEEGVVKVYGVDVEKINQTVELVNLQINGPEINKVYEGKVVTIKEYGAFVDIAQGISGLVHVSEIADERVGDVNDYLTEGQDLEVKVLEVDRFGKIKLSAKAVKPVPKKDK